MLNLNSSSERGVSPMRFLTLIAIVVPLIIGFVYLWTDNSPIYLHGQQTRTIGPPSKESVFEVNWTNAYPAERTAYVYTYTVGRWDDDARLVGIRTSIESLKNTGTKRSIVVMVDKNVDILTRQKLEFHGAQVVDMPVYGNGKDPINTSGESILGKCKNDFAPIAAWSLYEKYDRIVWMDGDILALLKLDELFLCGKFCTVYMNLNWYTPVLFVIKPDQAKYTDMMSKLTSKHSAVVSASKANTEGSCQQAWEDFYLEYFHPIEAAPAFSPVRGQQESDVMRLASGYALNPIFWYEKYDWSLARVKEYANIQGTTLDDVPAHALGWPRHKPWNWAYCMYFNIHCLWFRWSNALLGDSYFLPVLSYAILAGLMYTLHFFTLPLINQFVSPQAAQSRGTQPFRSVISKMLRFTHNYGATIVGFVPGALITLISAVLTYFIIPSYIPYFYAWPACIVVFTAFHMFFSRFIGLTCLALLSGKLAIYDVQLETTHEILNNLDKQGNLASPKVAKLIVDATSVSAYGYVMLNLFVMYGLLQMEIYAHFV